MAKLSAEFKIPHHIYTRLMQEGATEIIPEVVTHENEMSGTTEHEVMIRAKFINKPDTTEQGCPRPCPFVKEDLG